MLLIRFGAFVLVLSFLLWFVDGVVQLRGDVNDDGNINILDADFVVQLILVLFGELSVGVVLLVLVDVDCSETVNIFDADLIVDMLFDFEANTL